MTIMSKRGSLDNVVVYEHICDTTADMAQIDNKYITLGSTCIVISGETGGMEVYIADSAKNWVPLGAGGSSSEVAAMIGNLEDLDTTTKESLVAAINEINNKNTQPNYLQNDSTATDYIVNRPFYAETITTSTDLTDTLTFNCNQRGMTGVYFASASPPIAFQDSVSVGDTVKVIIDGQEFIDTFESNGSDYCIGGTNPGDEAVITKGYGILISRNQYTGVYSIYLMCISASEPKEVSVKIQRVEINNIVHKIDSQFLPTPDWNAIEGEDGYIANKPVFPTGITANWMLTDSSVNGYIANAPSGLLQVNGSSVMLYTPGYNGANIISTCFADNGATLARKNINRSLFVHAGAVHGSTINTGYSLNNSVLVGEGWSILALNSSIENSLGVGRGIELAASNQLVFGKYNATDNASDYVEIIGNGESDNKRANIRTLDWSGNQWLNGNLTVGGGSITVGSTTITEQQLQSLLSLLT